MYEDFFGFIEKPFNITPDTHFLYPSPQHDGVLKTLGYGIRERKGFLLLTGEVGTGKTTSLRALLSQLEEQIQTSLILNPLVSTLELLKTINRDFGCKNSADSLTDQINTLNTFLIENDQRGKNAVVVIDEAQNLSIEALEMTRLLSNLETESHKLLQIILVGQPELNEKLARQSLRQLAQRIQIFCELKPFESPDTERYIEYRIQRAGNNPKVVFEKSAMREIHKVSRGIPRRINTLCELALLAAYSREARIITRSLITEAARETPHYVHHS